MNIFISVELSCYSRLFNTRYIAGEVYSEHCHTLHGLL